MSPIKHSDRANVTYFWLVSFSTLLLLISSISHAPRLIHSNSSRIVDIVAFAWTLLPISGIVLDVLSRITWFLFGFSISSPVRILLSNTLLVTIALSLQYFTCIEQGYYSYNVPTSGWLFVDVPLLHCQMMESPRLILIPVNLTVVILIAISEIAAKLFGSSYRFFQFRFKRNHNPLSSPGPSYALPMVPWFSLSLTTTAIQLVVTLKMFVGRLDIRHILTALCRSEDDEIVFDLRGGKNGANEWIDFFADGGDGFNSTYAISRLMAQPNLRVNIPKSVRDRCAVVSGTATPAIPTEPVSRLHRVTSDNRDIVIPRFPPSLVIKRHETNPDMLSSGGILPKSDSVILPRSGIVVHGGDLAYPRPSAETYKSRFIQPLEDALGFLKSSRTKLSPKTFVSNKTAPRMFIIPGNHDWYDGLEAFVHWVIGRSNIGGWRLCQKSSYFCLRLSGNWWLLGLDLALSNDLDVFQYQAMIKIVTERILPTDRVLVMSHRPQWISDPYTQTLTGELYHKLLDKIGPSRLRMRLAGDLHHYSRFSAPGGTLPHLVVSGGAGAFLHPTHVPQESIVYEYFEMRRKGRGSHQMDEEEEEDEELNGNSSNQGGSEEEIEVADGALVDDVPFAHTTEKPDDQPTKKFTRKESFFETMLRAVSRQFRDQDTSHEFHRYRRSCTYPSEEISRNLTWMNPFHFRDRNWGADMILGSVYVCIGISILPICGSATRVVELIEESTNMFSAILNGALGIVFNIVVPGLTSVWTQSYFSILAQIAFWMACFMGAKAHNVWQNLTIATVHWFCHVVAAITIFACIEVGIEFLALVSEGKDSVISDGFRVPGVILAADRAVFNSPVFETLLTQFLRFIDIPSSLIRNRAALCSTINVFDRQLMFRYLWRVIPFFWIIATPVAGFIMGVYLLVNLNWFGLHMNEAFSSLRIEDYKNFIRMHIDKDTGDLHCYVVGIDKVPREWEEDPSWDPTLFKGQQIPPSWRWVTPSKWKPKGNASEPSLVDYFIVRR